MKRLLVLVFVMVALGASLASPAEAAPITVPVVLDPSATCAGPSGGGAVSGTAKLKFTDTTVTGTIKVTEGAAPDELYFPNLVQMNGSTPLDCTTDGYGEPKMSKNGKVKGKIKKEPLLASTTQVFMYLLSYSGKSFITQTKVPKP